MTGRPRGSIAIPLFIITIGIGWLLTANEVLPGVNWAWVLGLAVAGIGIMAVLGIDRLTIIIGPFLIISTIFSLLRQTGRMSVDTEIPALWIVAGVLWLLSNFLPVPPSKLFTDQPRPPSPPPP